MRMHRVGAMPVVLEIVERVGPAVLTFALGRATPRIVAEVKGHHARRFWAPVVKTDTEIVLGRHVHPEWEPSGLLGLGDARALAELRRHLRRLTSPSRRSSTTTSSPAVTSRT